MSTPEIISATVDYLRNCQTEIAVVRDDPTKVFEEICNNHPQSTIAAELLIFQNALLERLALDLETTIKGEHHG